MATNEAITGDKPIIEHIEGCHDVAEWATMAISEAFDQIDPKPDPDNLRAAYSWSACWPASIKKKMESLKHRHPSRGPQAPPIPSLCTWRSA